MAARIFFINENTLEALIIPLGNVLSMNCSSAKTNSIFYHTLFFSETPLTLVSGLDTLTNLFSFFMTQPKTVSEDPGLRVLPPLHKKSPEKEPSYAAIMDEIEALVYKALIKGQQEGISVASTLATVENAVQEAFIVRDGQ